MTTTQGVDHQMVRRATILITVSAMLALAIYYGMGGTRPSTATAVGLTGGTCAPGTSTTRDDVTFMLSASGAAPFRSTHSIPPIDTSTVRLLEAPADTAACRQLSERIAFGQRRAVYYQADTFYVVVPSIDTVETGRTIFGFNPIAVYNSAFAQIGILSE
jgi:hypothetical protein